MNLNSVELTTTKIFFKEFVASTLRKRKITEINCFEIFRSVDFTRE